ncbi:MAG: hypothetical protein LCH30_10265 [Proteobacteria bacterium]|nr:hypothetical protein [Pseudomonadota bacterium]
MENNNDRVLAYTLAKKVSHEELMEISCAGAHNQYGSGTVLTGRGPFDFLVDI